MVLPQGMRLVVRLSIVVAAVSAILASSATASPSIRYGVQDDAWLRYGPGTLTARLDRLQSLGVDLVRINLNWSDVERSEGQFRWNSYDSIVKGLHKRGIDAVLTLVS